jgi:hypothetical protein
VLARRFAMGSASWIERRKVLAVALGLVLVYLYAGPIGQYLPPPDQSSTPAAPAALGRWLAAHDLHYGYGGYWEASIVTVVTRGAVSVRPVTSTKVVQPGLGRSGIPPSDWRIVPYFWVSKVTWYSAGYPAQFLVFDPSSAWDRDTGVDLTVAAGTFGAPDHVYEHIGPYTVLVWDRPVHL